MIIVKITALLIVLFFVWVFLVCSWIKGNIEDYVLMQREELKPWYIWMVGVLAMLSLIGIVASAVYLLFFR